MLYKTPCYKRYQSCIILLLSQFKQLSKSRWIQICFSLVILQTILSVPILLKTLKNTDTVNKDSENTDTTDDNHAIFGSNLTAKGYKIIYENILFIVFEVWRLWTLTDGVSIQNEISLYGSSSWHFFFCRLFTVIHLLFLLLRGFQYFQAYSMYW